MTSSRPISGSFVLLDANVLYPVRVCDFILTASSLDLLGRPVVSAEILDEAHRNILTDRPDLEPGRIDRRFNAVRAATDGHDRPTAKRFVDRTIVNQKDRHVVAAALQNEVDLIITDDVRLRAEITTWLSRPDRRSKLIGAMSSDELAGALVAEDNDAVARVIAQMAHRFREPRRTAAEVLSGLRKSLPSLPP
jgi:PIN domain